MDSRLHSSLRSVASLLLRSSVSQLLPHPARILCTMILTPTLLRPNRFTVLPAMVLTPGRLTQSLSVVIPSPMRLIRLLRAMTLLPKRPTHLRPTRLLPPTRLLRLLVLTSLPRLTQLQSAVIPSPKRLIHLLRAMTLLPKRPTRLLRPTHLLRLLVLTFLLRLPVLTPPRMTQLPITMTGMLPLKMYELITLFVDLISNAILGLIAMN